jgi:hypothetical protein
MLDVRKFRSRNPLRVLFLLFLALSIAGFAQDKDDQDKDKGKDKDAKKSGISYIKLGGQARCEKPEPMHSIEVPDRPGHVLWLGKRKCSWTEPMELMGAKSKDGIAIDFSEEMENVLHEHGFQVDTFDNGEKVTMQTVGQVQGAKGPADSKGRWSLMRGTGKFKGIKGGGNYEGKLAADGVLILEFDGVYDPSDMTEKK